MRRVRIKYKQSVAVEMEPPKKLRKPKMQLFCIPRKKMVVEPALRDSKYCISDLNDKSDTLVILFGWAGCKDRYLSKYSQIYKDAGVSTIRYTAPIEKVRSFETYQHWAKYFYKHSIGKGVHIPDKVYIHSFSMNGCSLLSAFWDHLETLENGEKFKQKVAGMMFDSAPAFTTPSQSARAVSLATLPPAHFHPALRESYRAVLYTFFAMHRGVMWIRSFAESDIYEKSYAYCRMLAIEDLPARQLYLYGPGDDVCSAESIEAFADSQKSRQKEVILDRMEDSEHVAHYRTHPDRYRESCLQFIGIEPSQPSSVSEEITVTAEETNPEEQKVAQVAQ